MFAFKYSNAIISERQKHEIAVLPQCPSIVDPFTGEAHQGNNEEVQGRGLRRPRHHRIRHHGPRLASGNADGPSGRAEPRRLWSSGDDPRWATFAYVLYDAVELHCMLYRRSSRPLPEAMIMRGPIMNFP
jgi:hypothetical protein